MRRFILLVATLSLLTPAVAAGATHEWWTVTFTAPADYIHHVDGNGETTLVVLPIHHYEAVAFDQYGYQWTPGMYEYPDIGSGPPRPKAPGDKQTLSFLWPVYNRMPCKVYLISVDAAGNRSDSSNAICIIAGVPADTNAYDTSTGEWARTVPMGSTGMATWTRAVGDHRWTQDRAQRSPWSEVPTLALQSWIQAADKYVICHMFTDSLGHYWSQAGARRYDCPND